MGKRWHTAAEIAARLGGRWRGRHTRVLCPVKAHSSGETLALSETRDGRVLIYCHAGCSQVDVIDALKKLTLWPDGENVVDPAYPAHLTTAYRRGVADKSDMVKRQEALDIWDRRRPLQGSHGEAYLRGRQIRQPPSDQLGFIGNLVHSPTGLEFPAMVARLSDDNGFCAIQRTYLHPVEPRKIDQQPAKMSKGPMGGGAVRLRPPRERLGLAEGIETALSAAQLYSVPTWAALGAQRLGKIEIPATVRQIIIFADAGDVGRKEAFLAQDSYEARGYAVEVITPQAHHHRADASDFNDVLKGPPEEPRVP